MKRRFPGFHGFTTALALIGLLLFSAGPALAATIDGSVDDLTGNWNGVVYLKVMQAGGGETGFGTAIDLFYDDVFTIEGLQDGTYVVAAYIDESYEFRVPYGWSARGQSQVITISGGAANEPALVELDYPVPEDVPAPALAGVDIIAGDTTLGVFIKPERDAMGFYNADSVSVCYDTDPGFVTENCPPEFESLPVTGEEIFLVLNSLVNGQPIYLRATPLLDGNTGNDATANATPAAATGGHSVSGTLSFNFASGAPDVGTTAYVALVNDEIPGVTEPVALFHQFIADGSSSLPFTIPGVPDSYYYVYALVDLDGNGILEYLEPTNTELDAPLVEVAGLDLTGVEVALNDDPLSIRVNSQNQSRQGQNYYSLNFQIGDGMTRAVTVALVDDPLANFGRMDLSLTQWGEFSVYLWDLGYRPAPDDIFTFEVIDIYGDVYYLEVGADTILDTFASPQSPSGYILNNTSPDFSWTAPASPPQPFYSYEVRLWEENGGYYNQLYPPPASSSQDYLLASDSTSLAYPLGNDMAMDQPYQWMISVIDRFGNQASVVTEFTPVTELPFNTRPALFRNGTWFLDIDNSHSWNAGDLSFKFGTSGDIPVPADWNNDGNIDLAFFRAGNWYIDMNNSGIWDAGDLTFKFGLPGDIPVPADWNNDGFIEPALYRAGKWYVDLDNSHGWNAGDLTFKFGLSGDIPMAVDWNNDGFIDPALFRAGKWYIDANSSNSWDAGDIYFKFGMTGDIPVPADWNNDGIIEPALFRAGNWYLDMDGSGGWDAGDTTFKFGMPGDLPGSFQ